MSILIYTAFPKPCAQALGRFLEYTLSSGEGTTLQYNELTKKARREMGFWGGKFKYPWILARYLGRLPRREWTVAHVLRSTLYALKQMYNVPQGDIQVVDLSSMLNLRGGVDMDENSVSEASKYMN